VPAEPAAQVIHTVARGETLSAIAQRYLGDSNKWRVIAEANGVTDPRTLKVGQPLVIPGASPTAPQQEPTDATGNGNGTGTGETPTDNGNGTTGNGNGTTGNDTTGNDTQGQQTPTPDNTTGNGQGEQPQPQPPNAGAGEHIVTDPRAFVRSDPPALASTGTSIPAGTKVRIAETTVKEGRSYVKVEQVLQEGDPGPAQMFGWTSKANLAGFEGGGHEKENDASLRPEDAILLGGLSGLERAMAVIYNAKAKYLHEQAQALGISTAAAAAVLKVESGGGGFASDGRMIIRFENHVFYDRWGKNNRATFGKHFQYNSDKRWTGHKFRANENDAWAAAHQSQSQEWQILEFARGLSNDPALESISMGAAQIMGFNYATEGYTGVQQMCDQMSGTSKPQLVGMFTFIENTPLCINGLKENNYVKFARGYNGAGQAEHYGVLIRDAAAAWTRITEGKTYGG
jgi:LysM repeat protein